MGLVTLMQLGKHLILARILLPEDFGLMAIIAVVLGYGFSFADVGINKALVHFRDTTQRQRSTLYWLNIAAGTSLTLIVYFLAPILAGLFGEPRLIDLIRISGGAFFIVTFGQQFLVLLQKEFRFRVLAIINVVCAVFGIGVSISMALEGYGVWALLWGYMTNMTMRSLWLAAVGFRYWPPVFAFRLNEVKKYLSFGVYQLGTRIVAAFNGSIDHFLIGAMLGTEALGYYSLAFNIAVMPLTKVNHVFNDVMFPILAKVQDEIGRLRRGDFRMLKLQMIINVPLMIGLFVVAPVFVPVVLGSRWLPALPLIQLLALISLFRSAQNPTVSLLLAKGRADLNFRWISGITLVHTIGVAIGTMWGAYGVAAVQLVLQVCYSTIGYAVLIRPVLGPSFRRYMGSIVRPSALALIMAAPVLLLSYVLPISGMLLLMSQVFLGALIYVTLTWLLQRDEIHELGQLLLNR